jgi:hypothetical protein
MIYRLILDAFVFIPVIKYKYLVMDSIAREYSTIYGVELTCGDNYSVTNYKAN